MKQKKYFKMNITTISSFEKFKNTYKHLNKIT